MSKWQKDFNKEFVDNNCYCSNSSGLFIPNRQLSFIVSGLLFILFGVFMVGYFWGKRSSSMLFAQKMTESLIERIQKRHPDADVTVHYDPEGEQ